MHACDSPLLIENVEGYQSGQVGAAAVKTRTLGTDTDVDHISLDTNSGADTPFYNKGLSSSKEPGVVSAMAIHPPHVI